MIIIGSLTLMLLASGRVLHDWELADEQQDGDGVLLQQEYPHHAGRQGGRDQEVSIFQREKETERKRKR